jgi:hypothetical protein
MSWISVLLHSNIKMDYCLTTYCFLREKNRICHRSQWKMLSLQTHMFANIVHPRLSITAPSDTLWHSHTNSSWKSCRYPTVSPSPLQTGLRFSGTIEWREFLNFLLALHTTSFRSDVSEPRSGETSLRLHLNSSLHEHINFKQDHVRGMFTSETRSRRESSHAECFDEFRLLRLKHPHTVAKLSPQSKKELRDNTRLTIKAVSGRSHSSTDAHEQQQGCSTNDCLLSNMTQFQS